MELILGKRSGTHSIPPFHHASDHVSPMGPKGRSEVEVNWRASAEWLKYEIPALYVGGTTVPEPDVSSVGTAKVVSMAAS
jgi:hypothetical protein